MARKIDPLTVNLPEAHRITGRSNTSLYKKINDGTLKITKVGKRTLILYQSLLDMLEAGKSTPRDTQSNWKPPVPGSKKVEAAAPAARMRRRDAVAAE